MSDKYKVIGCNYKPLILSGIHMGKLSSLYKRLQLFSLWNKPENLQTCDHCLMSNECQTMCDFVKFVWYFTGCNYSAIKAYIFIIYLSRVLCLSSCRPVIFLSSCRPVCRCCGTLSYSLCFSHQTDQGDETGGLERDGLEMRDRRWRDLRGRV
jgi:hypothetical protein